MSPRFLPFVLLLAATPTWAQDAPEVLVARGDSIYATRDYPAAAEAYGAALDASGDGDALLEARALYGLGAAFNYMGRSTEADSLLGRALPLARAAGDRRLEARILHSRGTAHFLRADHERALVFYHEALDLAHEIGDSAREGILWNAIGNLENRRGNYAATVAAIRRAFPLVPRGLQPRVYATIATAYLRLARYEEALDAFAEGMALADSVGDIHARGMLVNGMANVYSLLGENDRAREAFEEALAITRQTGVKQAEAATLENLAVLDRKAGRLDDAIARLEEAIAVERSTDDRTGIGIKLLELAEVHLLRGETALALAAAREAVAHEVAHDQRRQEADARLALSSALLASGDLAGAAAAADTARTLAVGVGNPDLLASAETRQARALRALGRDDEALALVRDATERIESIRAALQTDPGKIGYLEERQAPFDLLVDLLVTRGDALGALVVAERARARAFADLLAGRVEVARAEDRVRLARIETAEAEAVPAASGEPAGGDLALRGAATVEAAIDELAREDPELASLISAQSIEGPAILELARSERATLVSYLVGDSVLTAWVVSPDGAVTVHGEDWPRAEVRAAVEAVRRSWQRAVETRLDPSTTAAAELAALHARLIAPIAERLPADPEATLVVIPHDALWLLPFAALRDAEGLALVERHTIAAAPSASVLAWLVAREAEATTGEGWLGMGSPTSPDPGLPTLPWAEREVETIAARFAPAERTLLVGGAATEAAFRALAPGRAAIHLAVHGIVSDAEPLASALALAPDDEHDGWLRTSEVFGLDLAADLVVLSGCSTGLGKLTGDGMLGLSRAFLFAGAPTVVVSLWDVSDRATAELMDSFYAARTEGLGSARSLRRAQLALKNRYSHPFVWASFTVIGRAE